MVSLQARHSRLRALQGAWTSFEETAGGCTCPEGPAYYVVVREGRQAHKEAVGRDRGQAEFALQRVAAAVEDGEFRPRPDIGFADWGSRWLASLERKPSTVGSYRSTIAHASEAFGGRRVRRLGPEDIARFNRLLRERGCSPSTRAKHLRVLGACLQAAVYYRYTEFPDLNADGELTQTNLIMPEPTPFLDRKFPVVSIIRPTETDGAAMGTVRAFTNDGLFIGQSAEFFAVMTGLAQAADAARHGT